MKKVTKVYKVYSFDELDEKGKEKALRNLSGNNVELFDWWESVYDDAEEAGIKIKEFDIDREQIIKGDFLMSAVDVAQKIVNDHGPDCETHKTAKNYLKEREKIAVVEFEDGEIDESIYEDIDEEFKREILEDYLIMLRKEYEYQTSEEAVIETIEANEYEFTADGEIFHV
jgi:hypothetical protein